MCAKINQNITYEWARVSIINNFKFLKLILGKVPICKEGIYSSFKFQIDGSNSM